MSLGVGQRGPSSDVPVGGRMRVPGHCRLEVKIEEPRKRFVEIRDLDITDFPHLSPTSGLFRKPVLFEDVISSCRDQPVEPIRSNSEVLSQVLAISYSAKVHAVERGGPSPPKKQYRRRRNTTRVL